MRHRAAVMLVALAALTTMAGTAIAGSDARPTGEIAADGLADRSRGLVYEGLAPGSSDGPCSGAYEIQLANGDVICTQGPDGAPADVDVLTRDAIKVKAAATADPAAESTTSAVCIGDGVSGPRVQAIYAVAADEVDRYEVVRPHIAEWAGEVDRVFEESAVAAGGAARHVRWATTPDCELDIAHVVLSPSGDDTFGTMINEMLARGFTSPNRKYLVWMDARVYCGIGQFQIDDRPGQDNRNNGAVPMFARTDAGCWGMSHSVEAHELTHVLGAVQRSAPHSTAHGHCWDEYDLMCYNDGSGVPMQAVCTTAAARNLDCNFDDYFNPNPPEGSYLAGHWNTADSAFLHVGSPDDPGSPPPPPPEPPPEPPPSAPEPPPEPEPAPPPDPTPPPPDPEPTPPGTTEPATPNRAPEVDAGPDVEGHLGEWITLAGAVVDDGLPRGRLAVRWAALTETGTVSFENDRTAVTRVRFSAPGTYVLRLRAGDSDLAATDRTTVTVLDVGAEAGGDMATEVFSGSIPADRTLDRITIASLAGPTELHLSATGRTRSERAPTMIIKVFHADGSLVASRRGRSPVALTVELPEPGLYTYAIRANRGTSYRFEISHLPR